METTQNHKIFNIENTGMFYMFVHLLTQIREAHLDTTSYQNEVKKSTRELYDQNKKDYKRINRHRAHFGKITPMQLEEEAHNYSLRKTYEYCSDLPQFDQEIQDRFVSMVNESSKQFIAALVEVLGEPK